MFGFRLIPRKRVRRFATTSNGGRSMLGISYINSLKRVIKAKAKAKKRQGCKCTTCQCNR